MVALNKCSICGEEDILVKGMCSNCYHKERTKRLTPEQRSHRAEVQRNWHKAHPEYRIHQRDYLQKWREAKKDVQ